jgi:thioredoxin-like negative regulator of GroEL
MYPDRVSVVKVDVESSDNIELAQYFEIHAIPEIRVFVDGQSVGAIHGFATAERIAQNLEPAMALLDRNSGS